MNRVLAALVCCTAVACAPGSTGALAVTVTFGPDSRANCVRVVVSPSGGRSQSTEALPRDGKSALKIGVVRSAELSGPVAVQAQGYVAPDCAAASFNEQSAAEPADLDAAQLQSIALTLDGPAPEFDLDGDHYRVGPDCLDQNATVHPGQGETRCGDGLDDDCSGAADCDDPACQGQSCNDGSSCTVNETCAAGLCVGTSACNAPGMCEKNPGSCAGNACSYPADIGAACGSSLYCRSDKTCASGEANCFNGLDDDNDGLTDCFDSDCSNQTCSGATACNAAGKCSGVSCLPGAPTVCADVAGSCFVGSTCFNDAGCIATAVADAGTLCTGGVCLGDGGCIAPETGAFCANGLDDDLDGLIDCADPGCAGAACEDGNACTTLQQCATPSCAGGMTVMCNSPGLCQQVGACQSDAGCVYPAAPQGTPCDGGFCTATGKCSPFPYVPSNFVPLSSAPDASVVLDCSAYVDTDNAANPFEGWCGDKPQVSVLVQDGGPELLVLSMRSYFQDAGVSLYAYGSRGVVLAVYGDAVVGGGTHPLQNPDGGALPGGHSLARGLGVGPRAWCLPNGTGANGQQSGNTAGGGGGGSFGFVGAAGGAGSGSGGAGGVGGSVNGEPLLVPLRGGCAGGNGGPTSTAFGGAGGGAIQFSVAGRLTIMPAARVGASGYGGTGGDAGTGVNGGAGGGGSGGGVLIEAYDLVLLDGGFISSNAAGGGQGDADNNAVGGAGGSAGRATVGAAVGSPGANLGGIGGRGGDGGSSATLTATPGADGASGRACGGGGGGGAGRVRLNVYGTCTLGGAVSGLVTGNKVNCP